MAEPNFDYIVVGSGAGGGPLAARLAEAGHDVLLAEKSSLSTMKCRCSMAARLKIRRCDSIILSGTMKMKAGRNWIRSTSTSVIKVGMVFIIRARAQSAAAPRTTR